MTDADHQSPDDHESAAEQAVAGRLRAWHEQLEPPAGAMDRAVAHVERQRQGVLSLTSVRRSKSFRTRLWGAMAAAAVLMVVGISVATRAGLTASGVPGWEASPTIGRPTGDARLRMVRFAVALPAEVPKDVRLVGDFNGWASLGVALTRNPTTGRWEGNIQLPPGLHHYTYLVDGNKWMIDPGAPSAGDDLLGATNAIVVPDTR